MSLALRSKYNAITVEWGIVRNGVEQAYQPSAGLLNAGRTAHAGKLIQLSANNARVFNYRSMRKLPTFGTRWLNISCAHTNSLILWLSDGALLNLRPIAHSHPPSSAGQKSFTDFSCLAGVSMITTLLYGDRKGALESSITRKKEG